MVALFTVVTGIALIWSTVMYLRIYPAVREHLPPQFQDDVSSRHAFSVWALRYPTPLPVQAEYVRYVKGSISMGLSGGLAFLSTGKPAQMVLGCVFLAAFVYGVFYAIRCSRIYDQNCRRAEAQNDEQN